jgi:predicted RNA-binding protein YlxR (DUF448 family)
LLRFVVAPDRSVVPDLTGRLPGRGAHTCLDPGCVAVAVQRRQFSRAFKSENLVPPTPDLLEEIRRLINERLSGLLALANKAGMVVSGGDAVERALTAAMAGGVVWISSDAAPERREKYCYLGNRVGCTVFVGGNATELGGLLGKEQRSFLLLKPSGITAKLRNELQRFRKFIDGGAQVP